MKKKISVVIPTYQRPALLQRCIVALARQDFALNDFEIIVVSDGPDLKTRGMLHSIEHLVLPYVQYITLPHNSGPAAARNYGWQRAQADLIAFTDDDCLPHTGWLSSLWNAFLGTGKQKRVAFSGRIEVPLPEHPTDFERNTAHLQEAPFVTANCACTKLSLSTIGGFDERFTTAWREDSDLEFKLIENHVPVLKINEALVVHPVRKAQWGVSVKEQKKTMFNALLYKKYPSLFRQRIQKTPAWRYYLIIMGFAIMIAGIIFQQKPWLIAGGILYAGLTVSFIVKRLMPTSRSFAHVMEMIVTSLVIPFASIYWTLYGSFKYRVMFY
jgi:glycosyltransferase involved in cell wall biosynthesis